MAALFSCHPRVPPEAIIGIICIVAAAAATMVLSRAAAGDEKIKNLLVGNILLVSSGEVIRTTLLYAVIGIFHFLLREKFHLLSFNPEEAERQGISVRLWDFRSHNVREDMAIVKTFFIDWWMSGWLVFFRPLEVEDGCLASHARGHE